MFERAWHNERPPVLSTITLKKKHLREINGIHFYLQFQYSIPGLLEFKLIARQIIVKKGCILNLRHDIPMKSKFSTPKAVNGANGAAGKPDGGNGADGIDGTDGIHGADGKFYQYYLSAFRDGKGLKFSIKTWKRIILNNNSLISSI